MGSDYSLAARKFRCDGRLRAAIASLATVFAMATAFAGAEWRHLDDDSWRSGPKLTPDKLKGKVVLVDKWGVFCPPCRASLPHLEAIWKKFRNKPFVLIGAHCQGEQREKIAELVKANNLTYSIYQDAGMVNEPAVRGIPFFYLLAPDGSIVYQKLGFGGQNGEQELENAIKAELAKLVAPDSLCNGVELNYFKAEAPKLVPGKNVEGLVSRLEVAAKKGDAKSDEARAILRAIEKAHDAFETEIRDNVRTRPGLALMRIETLVKTWPSEKSRYAKAYKKLSASRDVRAAVKLRRTLEALSARSPRNALEEKKFADARNAAKAAAVPFADSRFPGVAGEIAELLDDDNQ